MHMSQVHQCVLITDNPYGFDLSLLMCFFHYNLFRSKSKTDGLFEIYTNMALDEEEEIGSIYHRRKNNTGRPQGYQFISLVPQNLYQFYLIAQRFCLVFAYFH